MEKTTPERLVILDVSGQVRVDGDERTALSEKELGKE